MTSDNVCFRKALVLYPEHPQIGLRYILGAFKASGRIFPMEIEEVYKRLSSLEPFIEYLENTKDDEWIVDIVRSKDNARNCVMGHLINWFYGKDYTGPISNAWDIFEEMWATTYMIYPINDGKSPSWMNFVYDQTTPKARVVAYIKNLVEGKEKTTHQLMEQCRHE